MQNEECHHYVLFTLQFHIGMNYCLSFQNHLEIFLVPQGYLFFLYFFNVFNLGTNKEDLLQVTHCVTSSLPFDHTLFTSKLFQHVMSLTYEHVLFN